MRAISLSGWRRVKDWRHEVRMHHQLMNLSDKCLQDIGIGRGAVELRSSKPFWLF